MEKNYMTRSREVEKPLMAHPSPYCALSAFTPNSSSAFSTTIATVYRTGIPPLYDFIIHHFAGISMLNYCKSRIDIGHKMAKIFNVE